VKSYYRIMLGRKSVFAAECFTGGYIGTDFAIHQDLSGLLPEDWRSFNKQYISEYKANVPGASNIAAGLACGTLWTVSKGIKIGDVVLCPDGSGTYHVGIVAGDYYYAPGQNLPHRRKVDWLEVRIPRSSMSQALQRSTGSVGTSSQVTDHAAELEMLIGGASPPAVPHIVGSTPDIEDPVAFAMEKHLEDFLVANWNQTMLAAEYAIYQENGELVGQQFQTDAGIIDILAVSKDGTRLLVVELKRGRTTDVVVGQVLRYMGFVKEQLAEPNQTVEGVIIALDDDQKLRWALAAVPTIRFYRYEISFKLVAG
jgi:restriction system protein